MKPFTRTLRKDDRGAALVYVILTITLAAILTTGLMMLIVNRVRMLSIDETQVRDRYLADGVVEICKQFSDESERNDAIKAFLDEGTLIVTEPPQGSDQTACMVTVTDSSCYVIYYGQSTVTEIHCRWESETDPDNLTETLGMIYEITQTPRDAAENGGGA